MHLQLPALQISFHKHQPAASASPAEAARRDLHLVSITNGCISLVYFVMVLGLPDEKLWMSVVLLAGVLQITAGIGGILAVRMWIYT